MEIGRHNAFLQDEQGLDQPGHTCRCLKVTQVRLDRTQVQRIPLTLTQYRTQGINFDRVSQLGTSTVRLHVGDVLRLQTRPAERLL